MIAGVLVVVAAIIGALLFLGARDPSFTSSDDDTDNAGGDDETSDADEASDDDEPVADDGAPPASGDPLPVDPDTVTGTLDNGLTYFVRENDNPGGRVELRLAVNAGSALEDDDQRGAAHFLEHMLFNGTEKYPANELIATLESFGSQFGADVNAYTSYDETVYQLGLTDNTDELVDTALDVMHQWASAATILPAEVEAERGVVIEEWRQRDLGLDARTIQAYEQQLLAGSVYAEREPIGTIESLETLTADALRRFYDDWYRPDLMAVVVVGDIDADDIERRIVDVFSGLESRSADGPERPELIPVDVAAIEPVAINTDPEQTSVFAELMYPTELRHATTTGDLAVELGHLVVLDTLGRRLDADASSGAAPYRGAFEASNGFVRNFDAPSFIVDSEPELIDESVAHVATEIERLRQFGITEVELGRAVESAMSFSDQTLAEAGSRQDFALADEYVNSWLLGTTVSAPDDVHEIVTALLDEITLADVETAIDDLFSGPTAVAVFGADAAALPSIEQILAGIVAAREAELEPRVDIEVPDELMVPPEPAEIVEQSSVLGFTAENGTELTFANGVRVFLYPTNIATNNVVLYSESPGGFSVIAEEHVGEASLLLDLLSESGVGEFNRTELEQILSDHVVYVEPVLTDVADGFFGSSASDDLETMLQLVHLYSTQPRVDERAVATVVERDRDFYTDPSSDPYFAAQLALFSARYGPESRQRAVFFGPTGPQLDTITATDAQALMTDRFGDSTGAVFALVGDIDQEAATDLVRRYLGPLPTGRTETFVAEIEADPPTGVIEQTVAAGSDEQGTVLFGFSGAIRSEPTVDIQLRMLASVAATRLRDRLREQLGATYSPVIQITAYDRPKPVTEAYIEIGGEPSRLDEIAAETLAVLSELAASGPTDEEMETVQEQLGDELDLYSNEELAAVLVHTGLRPELDFADLFTRTLVVSDTTAADLRGLAAQIFTSDRYIRVTQIPE